NSSFGWLGVVGPMARSVRDVQALFNVMDGADSGDALSVSVPRRAFAATELCGKRIGILECNDLGCVAPETVDAVSRAAELLANQGFVVEPFRLDGLGRALELWWFFFGTVIGELLAGVVQGKEKLLSDQLKAYLDASRGKQPMEMQEFVAKSAARDQE